MLVSFGHSLRLTASDCSSFLSNIASELFDCLVPLTYATVQFRSYNFQHSSSILKLNCFCFYLHFSNSAQSYAFSQSIHVLNKLVVKQRKLLEIHSETNLILWDFRSCSPRILYGYGALGVSGILFNNLYHNCDVHNMLGPFCWYFEKLRVKTNL